MLLKNWLEYLGLSRRGRFSGRPRRRRCAGCGESSPWPAQVEHLEDRTLLTAYVVDTHLDDFDPNAPTTDGLVSLREAILAANSNTAVGDAAAGSGEGDTIEFALTAGNETIDSVFGGLEITDDLSIDGSNTANVDGSSSPAFGNVGSGVPVIIDANGTGRIFNILTDESADDADFTAETVTIGMLNVTGGSVPIGEDGGAVLVLGGGTTNLVDLTISASVGSFGGGVFFADGTLNVSGSTISNNTADVSGGGIYVESGTTAVVNSTISANTASLDGGGIYAGGGTLNLLNATVEANAAVGAGNGILVDTGATVSADNTIFSHSNGGGADDVAGAITGDFNLIQEAEAGANVTGTGNVFGVDPLLGPLADNGGSVQTHALLSGSAAIDAGNDEAVAGLAFDQRGKPYERLLGASVDIGAFEAPGVIPLVNGHAVVTGTFDSPGDFDEYRFTASSDGRFQISLVALGDDATYTVLNSTGNPLTYFAGGGSATALSQPVERRDGSYETAWFELTAGAEYTIRVDHNDGGTGDYTVEVSDVFLLDGATLYINGSLGDDTFTYAETPLGTLDLTMNGVEETFLLANVDSVLPQGWDEFGTVNAVGATGDLAVISGRAGVDEIAMLGVGGGVLIREGDQLVTMAEFETSAFYGQDEDSGQLTDSPALDFFVTAGTYSYMTNFGGEASFRLISGVSNVYGYTINGGADQAWHYDTAGNDIYVASGTAYSYMSGGSGDDVFFNVAVGFDVNYGFASGGGVDYAYFFDSPGDDTFVSEQTQAYMSGPGFFSAAIGFEFHIGLSFVGGEVDFDTAYNFAPSKTRLAGFNDVNT